MAANLGKLVGSVQGHVVKISQGIAHVKVMDQPTPGDALQSMTRQRATPLNLHPSSDAPQVGQYYRFDRYEQNGKTHYIATPAEAPKEYAEPQEQ
ncbi:MAG: hypothetical protein ABH879_06470 [archaeon]